ncbi:hypothetical protein B808_1040 [Fructilactobacillus florum 8D]|uniref:Uncharacterized protein n=1 Tax=Fructilactobacillus florum 8D TaxID=1221538 RepID=W9EFK9_9LACO|nr:hypothetical protein B807_50 [Fructilactobacillus florum 2F]ETO40051.1 hypothetical protein B808_1040 [Fructilactobacillus florum 8D]
MLLELLLSAKTGLTVLAALTANVTVVKLAIIIFFIFII